MRPLTVMHVLFRFSIGGLENGIVNLVNGLDHARYRHCIVCLDDYDEQFLQRMHSGTVEMHALHKRPGQDLRVWQRLWQLLRTVRPDVLHTRNFAALELQTLGWLAQVRGRVHGEHGWDVHDLDGSRARSRLARRVFGAGVRRFVALSRHLQSYLVNDVGIAADKVSQIYNGVSTEVFQPQSARAQRPLVIGTVGRMKTVKNQTFLCRAYVDLISRRPRLASVTRLRLVGDGPLRADCAAVIATAGCADLVEFVGASAQVAVELRAMDIFVLPSLAEGISNTILEAMASGLPVIATAVGGNPELVADDVTGQLVAVDDVAALSVAIERYIDTPQLRITHGARGRALAIERFSLSRMIAAYDELYCAQAGVPL